MATMDCNEFLHHLEPWLEGSQHPEARVHLHDCSHCRGLVEDFGALQTAARELSAADPEPPARVWTSLRAQLEQEGLIRDGRRTNWLRGALRAHTPPGSGGSLPRASDRRRIRGKRPHSSPRQRLPLDRRKSDVGS